MSFSWSQLSDAGSMARRSQYSARGFTKRAKAIQRYRKRTPLYKSVSSRINDAVIVCRTVQSNHNTTADVTIGLGWSATNMWVNGISSYAIDGASDITNLYDIVRIKKVEVNILLDYNVHEVTATSSAGLPIVYTAFDPTDNAPPTAASIKQYATCKMEMMGDARVGNRVTRTFYPRLQNTQSSYAIINPLNNWVESGSDIPYNGCKIYMDQIGVSNPNRYYMIVCKIYYECKISK